MEISTQLEMVILERRCPDCGDENIYFAPHTPGETFEVECDTCGWEGYFTSDQIAEVRPHIPDSTWRTIHNWQSSQTWHGCSKPY